MTCSAVMLLEHYVSIAKGPTCLQQRMMRSKLSNAVSGNLSMYCHHVIFIPCQLCIQSGGGSLESLHAKRGS